MLLAGGFAKTNAGAISSKFPPDTLEKYLPFKKGATDNTNVTNRLEVLTKENKIIGGGLIQVQLETPIEYKYTKTDGTVVTRKQQVLGIRFPNYISLTSVGLLLSWLNAAAGSGKRPYTGVYGPSGRVLYAIPGTSAEVTEAEKELVQTSTEAS